MPSAGFRPTRSSPPWSAPGNGRARLEPRPISQPWLLEAVGTGRWRGVRLCDLLDRAGIWTIEGRAWSGLAPVAAVEVSTDDGATWQDARLDPPELRRWAWQRWSYDWNAAERGRHVLS